MIYLNCEYLNKHSFQTSGFFIYLFILFLYIEYGHHYESGAPGGTGGEIFLNDILTLHSID